MNPTFYNQVFSVKKSFYLLILWIAMLFCSSGFAQIYPVQVNTQLIPPYSLKLSDYVTTYSDKLIANILMTDITEYNRQVRFRLTIKGNGLHIRSNNFVIGANPVFIDGGLPLRLTNIDLRPYFEFQNLQGITPQQYNSPLPDGNYQFCIEVLDWISGQRLSNPQLGCSYAYLIVNDPPFLNLPRNGDLVEFKNPQNIIFNWTPRHLNAINVQYEFELRELWDTQIDPRAAFLASPNLYQTTTRNTTLLYGPGQTPLLENKTYAWRVRALVSDGISETSMFRNSGYSEIYYFTYAAGCSAPEFILAKSLSSDSEEITWQPNVDYKAYKVQYKKKDVRGAVWFDTNTTNPHARIYNLEPGTTYEFRVGGQCMLPIANQEPRYSFSGIQEFTTPTKEEDSYYNCGIAPEIRIKNKNPLPNLTINEVFTAGDFPVTVKGIEGQDGIFSGIGYIVVPYLADTKIAVEFNNIRINTDYQLYAGTLYTTYDPTWGNVVDVTVGLKEIADIPKAIGELVNVIGDFYKERAKRLDSLEQLQKALLKDAITQEEFEEKANKIVELDNKAIDYFNGNLKDNVVNNPYATDAQKEVVKNLGPTALVDNGKLSSVDTKPITAKDGANYQQINTVAKEVAAQEQKAHNYLFSILMAMKAMDGNAYLKCKECGDNTKEITYDTELKRFSGKIGSKVLMCILGNIENGEPNEPSKFTQRNVSEQERETLQSEFKTLENLVLNKQEGFLVINKKDNDLLECNTELDFEGFCSNSNVSDIELQHLTEELQQCNPTNITDVHSILVDLNKQIRSNQAIEWATEDKVYALNENGQVETVSLTDEQVNAGDWSDSNVDLRMRMTFDENDALKYTALGIRSSLKNIDGKRVDNKAVAQNMLETANSLLLEYGVKDIHVTLTETNYKFESDTYPDGKKVNINKNVSYVKYFSELGGITTNFLRTTEIEQPVYVDNYDKANQVLRIPPVLTGTIEAAAKSVTEITEIVSTGWDLATKPKVRKEAVAGFIAIKDEPSSLFPILKEVVLEEATGLTSDNLDELDIATARGQHLTTKATIRTVATVFAGGGFIIHLPKMADDLAAKMLDAKLIAKFRKAQGFDENLLTIFKKDLNELLEIMPEVTESITKISDFTSAQELTELVAKMNTLKEVPGLDKVITDMATQWNKFHGGQFVLDYFSSKIENLGGRLRFEVKEAIKNSNGDAVARVYDGFLDKGGKVTKYELKNWSGWYPSTIRTQFIRDLQGINNLEELKWVFNSTSGVNKGNLKSKILATLKKADGSAVDELEAIFKENPLAASEKYSTLFGREINSAEDIIDALDDDAIFNKLFKTAE